MDKIKILAQLNAMCKDTLMETLEIKYTEIGDDYVKATMPVNSRVHQPDGILNGGATMALAESLGSPASLLFIDHKKYMIRGISFTANHLKSVKDGVVTATARFIHKGRTTHLLEIRIENEKNELISLCKLTNIILPKK